MDVKNRDKKARTKYKDLSYISNFISSALRYICMDVRKKSCQISRAYS